MSTEHEEEPLGGLHEPAEADAQLDAEEWLSRRRAELVGAQQATVLRGDLVQTPLTALFADLASQAAEGTLRVRAPLEQRYLYFRGGMVQIFVPRRRSKRLGDRLVHVGRITRQDLQSAVRAQRAEYKPLGRILVEAGLVTQDEIDEVAEYQAAEDLFALFTWPRGEFEFVAETRTDPEIEARLDVLPSFDCQQILLEVERRASDWESILAVIGNLDDIFVARPTTDPHELGEDAFQVLSSLDGSRSVRDLVDATLYSLFDCARIVADLCERALIERSTPVQVAASAEALRGAGEQRRAVRMLETQLLRDDLDAEAALAIAQRLEVWAEPKLAAGARVRASRLLGDGDAAIESAERACALDPHSSPALARLRELLAARGDGARLLSVTRRLVDALTDDGHLEDALALAGEIEDALPDDVEILDRKARVLHRLGRDADAVACLDRIAALLEAAGGSAAATRKRLAAIYEQIVALDPRRKDAAARLSKLQTSTRTLRTRRLARLAAGFALVAVGLAGVPLWVQHRATERARRLTETFAGLLTAGEVGAARELLDRAIAEHGDSETTASLQQRLRDVVERQRDKSSRDRASETRNELGVATGMFANAQLWAAFQRFHALAQRQQDRALVTEALSNRLDELARRLEAAARELAPLVGEPTDILEAMELRRRATVELAKPSRTEELRFGQALLDLRDDPAFEALVEPERRTRLLRAAEEVVRSLEHAAAKQREQEAIRAMDPLVEEAQRLEQRHAFRDALAIYERLIAEHPGSGAAMEHFRERARQCTEILYYLHGIEQAAADGDTATAVAALRSLRASHPEIPFETFVRLPLRIATVPPGAVVRIDGVPAGRTPLVASYLPTGNTVVRVELEGFEPREVTLGSEADAGVELDLVKAPDWTFETRSAVEARTAMDGHGHAFVVDRSGRLFALDVRTGRRVWEFVSNDLSGLLPSPVTHGPAVIVASVDGPLRALARGNGDLIWDRPGIPCEGAPVVSGGTLVAATTGGELVGLRADTGDPLYRTALPGPVTTQLREDGGRVVLVTANGRLVCARASDGALLWNVRIGQTTGVAPCVGGGVAVGISDNGKLIAVDIATGASLWRRSFDEVVVSPVAVGQTLIVADGETLRAFGLRDGKPGPTRAGESAWCADLASDGTRLFAGNRAGQCVVLDVATLARRYVIAGPGAATAPASIGSDGAVVVGFEGHAVQGFARAP